MTNRTFNIVALIVGPFPVWIILAFVIAVLCGEQKPIIVPIDHIDPDTIPTVDLGPKWRNYKPPPIQQTDLATLKP